jgi:hypothetical protein
LPEPEVLWKEFPLEPTPTPGGSQQAAHPATPTPTPTPQKAHATATPTPTPTPQKAQATAAPTVEAAATATPTPTGSADAGDGKIELPGGASITFPAANGTEKAITSARPQVPTAQQVQVDSGDPVDISGQAGLYVVVVAVLVVLMARWLLNHPWRAAVTVAVMLIGMAMVGLIIIRWAADLGIVT